MPSSKRRRKIVLEEAHPLFAIVLFGSNSILSTSEIMHSLKVFLIFVQVHVRLYASLAIRVKVDPNHTTAKKNCCIISIIFHARKAKNMDSTCRKFMSVGQNWRKGSFQFGLAYCTVQYIQYSALCSQQHDNF